MIRKLKILVILFFVTFAFTGVAIWWVLPPDNDMAEDTVVDINGETSKTLEAELSDFYPGCAQEYRIVLTGDYSNYVITLAFRTREQSGILGNFLTLVIETANGRMEKSLKNLLGGEKAVLGKNVSEITLTYVMPESIGNEAQGTTASFYIDVTASNVV